MLIKRLTGQKLNLSQLSGLLAALLVLSTGLLISLLSWSHIEARLTARLQQDAQRQLQRLTVALAPSLLLQDRVSISITLQEWVRGPELDAIRVFNNSQQIIAESGRPQPGTTEISQPVTQDNLAIGVLRADLNLSGAHQAAMHYLGLGLMITALCALAAALLVFALSERYLGYLRQLQQRLQHWQDDDSGLLQLPEQPVLADLRGLHQTLSALAQHQQQQRAMQAALGPFTQAPPPAASACMQYHQCTLLFVEIHNLDALQQQLPANALTRVLNHYHRLLSQAAKLYNGKLDRYVGNGAVMLFGIGSASADDDRHHALHCLYAAQLFCGLVQHIRAHDKALPEVDFRLAAHSGPVLLAPVDEQQYSGCSLIGDTLHWAAHLASKSADLQLLVSQSLQQRLTDASGVQWRDAPSVTDLNGQPQPAWWLSALADTPQQLITRQIRHITAMTESV